jgi:hypothetical protein
MPTGRRIEMKLVPLKQWICDTCGEIIEKADDGWFEWYSDEKTSLETGFRIVHHRDSCMYNDRVLVMQNRSPSDLNLVNLIGGAGLGYFLFSMELSEAKNENKLADIKEYIEIIRRLHLPYWEEARLYWDMALTDGSHDGCDFSEDILRSIINEYGETNTSEQ